MFWEFWDVRMERESPLIVFYVYHGFPFLVMSVLSNYVSVFSVLTATPLVLHEMKIYIDSFGFGTGCSCT